jgi:hypothetical protein
MTISLYGKPLLHGLFFPFLGSYYVHIEIVGF